MCGFIGIYYKNHVKDNIHRENIRSLLHHRGPDDYKEISSGCGRINFHFFRLSILDLESGAQPIYSDDGSIVSVFNGEIYNYKELRNELVSNGVNLKTKGDAEVIPNLYKLYGEKFVDKLRGMFSILLWDGEKLHVYRDRLGIKPLYYAEDNERIVFSSEIRPLHKLLKITKDINKSALADYLRYGYVLSNNCIYKDVNVVAPATHILVYNEKILVRKYWDINSSKTRITNESEALEQLEKKMVESIGQHLVSDVPVAIYLSGGLDSGIIAALSSRTNKELTAYTLKFKESYIDESVIAKEIADKYNIKHKVIEVSSQDLLDLLTTSIYSMEQPLADSGALANLFITREAHNDGVKVVLCGAGGDETFGGYTYHVKTNLEKKASYIAPLLRLLGHIIGGERGRKIIRTASFDHNPCLHYIDKTRVFHNLNFFKEGLEKEADNKKHWFEIYRGDSYTKRLYADLHTYIPDNLMLLLDRATMRYSVEGRLPLLDHELVELALSIDKSIRHPNKERKGLLKKICKKYLPSSVFDLPKTGFNSPVQQWMSGEFGETVEKILQSKKFKERVFWNELKLEKLLAQKLNFHQKWTLFQLEMFCRVNLDNDFQNNEEINFRDLL